MAPAEQSRFDFDAAVEEAWHDFALHLVDLLEHTLAQRGVLRLRTMGSATGGDLPWVELSWLGERRIRVEVSSSEQLACSARLAPWQEEHLALMEICAPYAHGDRSGAWWYEFNDDAPLAATVACRVMREVFDVQHPELLDQDGTAPSDFDAWPAPEPVATASAVDLEPVELDTAYVVHSPDELADLVERTIAQVVGVTDNRDEDGDWPIPGAQHLTYARLVGGRAAIRLWAVVVRDVERPRVAAREVALLNRDAQFVRWSMWGDELMAEFEVVAGPFVPRHFIETVSTFQQVVTKAQGDFMLRAGGSV